MKSIMQLPSLQTLFEPDTCFNYFSQTTSIYSFVHFSLRMVENQNLALPHVKMYKLYVDTA